MAHDDLAEAYAFAEAEQGRAIAKELLSGGHTILRPLALYPEYAQYDLQAEEIGLHRPGVNLGLLLFFYSRAIAYVPPLKRGEFEARFGVDLEAFLALADPALGPRRFLFPVLGHPRHYHHPEVRSFLAPLLATKPLTWERWHKALEVTGGDRWFHVAERHLRLDELEADGEFVRKWMSRHSAKDEADAKRDLRQQAKNRFVDLCLVGLEDEAKRLASQGSTAEWFAALDYSSEVFAYPYVIGAGGAFNYVTKNSDAYLEILRRLRSDPVVRGLVDADVLRAILEGFEFHKVPKVHLVDYLLHYHRSSEAEKVRAAYARVVRMARRASGRVYLADLAKELKEILDSLKQFCSSSEAHPRFKGELEKDPSCAHSAPYSQASTASSIRRSQE